MRQTKTVVTIGPASSSKGVLADLISGGADVLRLNFSHGSREQHIDTIRKIRAVSGTLGIRVAILQDLCGPKIRLGVIKGGQASLEPGSQVMIVPDDIEGDSKRLTISHKECIGQIAAGDRILINDGSVELSVQEAGETLVCLVARGGLLSSCKGVNLPDSEITLPSVTEKDLADLEAGIREGVDFIALSFVRRPEDLEPVRSRLIASGSEAQLIAKIEKPEAIRNMKALIAASDGVLVARGDLGVEVALEEVPFLQKQLVREANLQDKYVIVATQMLESMTTNAVPTRAEVSDVANAILDGTDAVMLSVETSAGRYPVESLKELVRIAGRTDAYAAGARPKWDWDAVNPRFTQLDAVGHAVHKLCTDLNPAAIITRSETGGTALFVSKNRPACPVVAFTGSEAAARRMRLFWGVRPVVDDVPDAASLVRKGLAFLVEHKMAGSGDTVLCVFCADPASGGADSVRIIKA